MTREQPAWRRLSRGFNQSRYARKFGTLGVKMIRSQNMKMISRELDMCDLGETYAEAAWRPNPLEPPVTTATLPSREKSEGKSLR